MKRIFLATLLATLSIAPALAGETASGAGYFSGFSDTLASAKDSTSQFLSDKGPFIGGAALLVLMANATKHQSLDTVSLNGTLIGMGGPVNVPVDTTGLNTSLSQLDKLASAGPAAMGAIPALVPTAEDPVQCGVGTGSYNGARGLGVACAKRFDRSSPVTLRAGYAIGPNGHNAANAAVIYSFR